MIVWVFVQWWKFLKCKLSRMGFIWCFKPCGLHVMDFYLDKWLIVEDMLPKFLMIMWWVFIIIQMIEDKWWISGMKFGTGILAMKLQLPYFLKLLPRQLRSLYIQRLNRWIVASQDVKYTKHEEDRARETRLSITNKLSQPVSFVYNDTSVQMSGEKNWKNFQDDFFTLRIHNNHEKPENAKQLYTYSVLFPSININIYITPTKVNFHRVKFQYKKLRNYPQRIIVILLQEQ